MNQYPYLLLSIITFLINIPLGYIRENSPKFSFKWLFWIHASIPLIIYLRITLGTGKWFIPICIGLAIAGQVIGSRYRRKTMPKDFADKLQQIPDLRLPKNGSQHIQDTEVMVVLLNMGGPETTSEVRPFLKRLFLDRFIIRFPLSLIFQPLFASLITALRGKETEKRYGLIGGGSPILKSSMAQVTALTQELKIRGRNIDVTLGFNYSQPLPKNTIAEVKKAGKKCILPISLYPHYSDATTGSHLYYLKRAAKESFPLVTFLKSDSYYLADTYINAFLDRMKEQLQEGESLEDFYLLFSAHGLPLYFLTQGDPYPFQIAQTVTKILGLLNRKERWAISYQSAVGPLQWLKPSTESMIQKLAEVGIKKLFIIPVSFVTDHIETLCEIDIEYRAVARGLGIEDFRMSRALECHPGFIRALADCVESSLPPCTCTGEKRGHTISAKT